MAKIDVTKIDGYEKLSAEEKVKLLESFEYDDNAGEVERYKNAVSKANSEAAEWKKKHNALLSEEEKSKQETADYIANLEKLNKELTQEKTIATYKAELLKIGYSEDEATATAKAYADGDIIKALKNQAVFVEAQKKAVVAEDVKNNTPIPPVGNESKTLTKAEFQKMSLNEQLEVYEKTPELYSELTKS
jgi:DNA repair exonuclease SbcCD ATPase subunit